MLDLPPILTVSDVSHSLKKTIEETYSSLRIKGEISGFKKHSSGHSYFALKDAEAVIDAVAWRGSLTSSPAQLEEGLEIIATGRLTTYMGRSKYQLIVSSFEPAGIGALLKQLEERKNRLRQEGLFALEKKRPLPSFPQIIGVVTSPTGAVIQDILHRLKDRFPCHVIVWPVLVQGPGAADQISTAIDGFNTLSSFRPDLLIVARGGGSLEDLWAFNEENVVRSAANSQIPLISAVGHETDTTLIDFAADLRAPTPTAAAEIAVPVLSDLWAYIQDRYGRCLDVTEGYIQTQTLKVQSLKRGLTDPKYLIEDKIGRLDEWQERLVKSIHSYCLNRYVDVKGLSQQVRHPDPILSQLTEKTQGLVKLMNTTFHHFLNQKTLSFDHLQSRLKQGDYRHQLERGFCRVLTPTGQTISSAAHVVSHQVMDLHFKDGIVSVVSCPSSGFKKKQKNPKENLNQQQKLF